MVADLLRFDDNYYYGGCHRTTNLLLSGEKYKLWVRFDSHTEIDGYILIFYLKGTGGSNWVIANNEITNGQLMSTTLTAGSTSNQDIVIQNSSAGMENDNAVIDKLIVQTVAASKATTPDPANNAKNIAVDKTLGWTLPSGGNITKTKLYLRKQGEGWGDPVQDTGSAETSYNPGGLDRGIIYQWRVDTINGHNETTTGDTWTFETIAMRSKIDSGLADGSLFLKGLAR